MSGEGCCYCWPVPGFTKANRFSPLPNQAVHLLHSSRFYSSRFKWALFLLVGLLLFLAISFGRNSQSAVVPTARALPQDPYIQVYFNHSQANVYTEPYRQIKRQGDDLEQVIVDSILQARQSIDVAVHEINLPKVALALRDRMQAGVQVRVIVENTYSQSRSATSAFVQAQMDERDRNKQDEYQALVDQNHDGQLSQQELEQRDAIYILHAAQVPLIDDTADGSKGSGLMHHKFMVVDQRYVLTGSTNWTTSDVHGDALSTDSRGNANALLKIDSPTLAQTYAAEFNLMWGDGPKGKADSRFGLKKPKRGAQQISLPGSLVMVQFSPTSKKIGWTQSTNGLIDQTLNRAQRNVDLALFVFSDQPLGDRLAQKSQAGVTIRALVDPEFIYRNYSEALDMLGVAIPDEQCRPESGNHLWTRPISTVGLPALAKGDKLHHKFALIDNATVIVGSHNWSKAANETNDENVLVITNPTVAAHFRQEFDQLYQTAELGMHSRLQTLLQSHRSRCGLS